MKKTGKIHCDVIFVCIQTVYMYIIVAFLRDVYKEKLLYKTQNVPDCLSLHGGIM